MTLESKNTSSTKKKKSNNFDIYLASSSPRRTEILKNLKVNFGNGTDPFMAFRSGHGFNTDFGNDSTSGYAAGAPKFKNYQYFLLVFLIQLFLF